LKKQVSDVFVGAVSVEQFEDCGQQPVVGEAAQLA
jgi:hypothetical protein